MKKPNRKQWQSLVIDTSFKEEETYADYGIIIPNNRMSGQVRTHCPQCSSQRRKTRVKCLGVNLTGGYWHCIHCKWKGRLKTIKPSVIYMKKEYKKPVHVPKESIHSGVVEYFKTRGISEQTVKALKITNGKEWMPQTEKEEQAIKFNYFRSGELVNIKFRTKEKHFKLVSGAELIFYNLDSIRNQSSAIITEGEIGAATWHEIGYTNVISVPNGAALSKDEKEHFEKTGKFIDQNASNLEYIDNSWDCIKHIEKWYIATDNDAPGRKLRQELIRRLGPDKCYIIDFGSFKDENDVLLAQGAKPLHEALAKATQPEIEGVVDIDAAWDYMVDVYDNGRKKGAPVGIDEFDGHFSLRSGELTIVNGYPGDGKTTVVFFLMVVASIRYGWKWAIYSPENYPIGDLYDQLIEIYIGKTSDRDAGKFQMSKEEYEKGRQFVGKHFFAIDPENITSVDDLLNVAEALVKRKGINGMLIDPWNDLEHVKENGENEHDYLMRRLRQIRHFKRRLDFYFLINHHPVTIREKDANGAPIVPTAYHLSGGSMWRNRADNILTVYRRREGGESDPITEIHAQKIKFHKLVGKPTDEADPIKIEYFRNSNRFRGVGGSTIPEFAEVGGPQRQQLKPLENKLPEVDQFAKKLQSKPIASVVDEFEGYSDSKLHFGNSQDESEEPPF